jgi:hypothetical protein
MQLEPTLLINARVHIDPEDLQAIIEQGLRSTAGNRMEAAIAPLRSFRPGRPRPTHRFEKVL